MSDHRRTTSASQDGYPTLTFPNGLFGRARELALLVEAARRPRVCPAVIIQGPPGIGKSALLDALRHEIGRAGGWCAVGAFADQPLPIPYSGFVIALTDLAHQLLAEPPSRVRQFEQRLRTGHGRNGGLLASLVPAFETIVGKQPITSVDAGDQPERLVAALRTVFGILTESSVPLVLCLDDLQWADRSSLEILRRLLLESPPPEMLVILAMRSPTGRHSSVDTGRHSSVDVTLAEIQRQRSEVTTLDIAPLDVTGVGDILRAALSGDPGVDIASSAEALHAVTQGNPLLLRQALSLPERAMRWQQGGDRHLWRWHPTSMASLPPDELLHALLAQRLQRLDTSTLDTLNVVACCHAVDPAVLKAVLAIDDQQLAESLQRAAAAGLLITVDDAAAGTTHFRFVHGEVQRVLLVRLTAEQRSAAHLRIADFLLCTSVPGTRAELIFTIVGHLVAALDPARDGARAPEVAALFLEASRAALAITAIDIAAQYAELALTWAAAIPDGWRTAYQLNLEGHELAARMALYTGDYKRLAQLSKTIFQEAQTPIDMVGVYKSCITAATLQGDYDHALDLLQGALAELGVRIPRRPTTGHMLAAYGRVRLALRSHSATALQALPTTTDRTWWEIGDLVTSAYMAMQWSGQRLLMAYLSLQGVRWSVQHGHTPLSVIAYALYSVILTNRFGDPAAGAHYARLATGLSERRENYHQRAGVLLTLNALVFHLSHPAAATVEPLRQARQFALDSGDVRLATDCTLAYINHAHLAGTSLDAMIRDLGAMLAELEPFGDTVPLLVGRMMLQNLLNLAGEADEPCVLTGHACQEEEVLARLQQAGNRFGMNAFYSMKASLNLLFGRPQEAVETSDQARVHADAVGIGLFAEAARCQVAALARLAACGRTLEADRRRLLRAVAADLKELRRWATRSPMNHRHRVHQVEAELAHLHGRYAEAEQHYADAWSLASAQGFVHDEGGAAELAARHFLHIGQFDQSAAWRRRAVDAYRRWGSQAKLRYLDRTLPVLTGETRGTLEESGAPPMQAVLPSPPAEDGSVQLVAVTGDLRGLSAQTEPQAVIRQLLCTLLSHTQASRATFLVCEEERTILYADLGAGEPAPVNSARLVDDDAAPVVPLSAVRLALHQQTTYRAGPDEVAALAARDPYLQSQPPMALLCVPLTAFGHTVALLCLERWDARPHAGAAFDETEALYAELLGTPAALLVENSRLRARLVDAAAPVTGESPAELTAWLLGGMHVLHRSRDLTPLLPGRLRDLVALLLLQPAAKPLTREAIAAALWPETVESQALTNVRNLLYKLRTAWPEAGDLLEITRHQIQWKAQTQVWVDVHAFERGLAEAGRLGGGAAIHLLRTSVAQYAGDLLPGASDDWILPLQERLREHYLAALGRLINLLVDQHDLAGALHAAQRLVAAAPLREDPYRHLIRVHALAGDTVAARQAYAACVSMLAREFDTSPSPATEAVYRQFVDN